MNKIVFLLLTLFFINAQFLVAFNPASASEMVEDVWSTKTAMTQTRLGLGVVAVDNKIYAIGGYGVDGVVGTNECYDPKTDKWVTLEAMPTPRSDLGIVGYQNKIYCIGGQTADADILDVNEVYDIATDMWHTKAALPIKGRYLDAQVIDGKIFVLSNREPYHDSTLDVYMYDPIADVWLKKTTMPESSESSVYLVSAVVNGKIMITGSFPIVENPHIRYEYKVMFYDPKSDVWSKGADGLSEVHVGVTCVTSGLYVPQRVYVLGLNVNNVYDPISDTWSTAKTMPSARKNFGAAVVDDVLYVIGGYTSDDFSSLISTTEPLALNEQYIPADYTGTLSTKQDNSSEGEKTLEKKQVYPDTLSTKQDNSSEPILNYHIITAVTLTVGIIATGFFVYFKKTKRKKVSI
ncbi:MAG: hypothetical protein FWH37_07630 [Candidatus Bathyarchaeota archaeon]|nr:hypothetical protein [Candidatus Termiticorpusculum sp.]